ncbi:hypothetical protein D5H75_40105 [Bailinhaonella thermotolerans]|uniref:Uncharacterized protein n=2 Tax=Bailinhaonella thermotolerans TaxID=1070861 RepID=A0A3A4A3C4_9ACTN|nr:hypothetical protein D5H75_40105 [Bailinhaonella thermotolerans]
MTGPLAPELEPHRYLVIQEGAAILGPGVHLRYDGPPEGFEAWVAEHLDDADRRAAAAVAGGVDPDRWFWATFGPYGRTRTS